MVWTTRFGGALFCLLFVILHALGGVFLCLLLGIPRELVAMGYTVVLRRWGMVPLWDSCAHGIDDVRNISLGQAAGLTD